MYIFVCILLFSCYIIYLLATLCSSRDPSSLTRGRTWAFGSERTKFQPLDCQGIPCPHLTLRKSRPRGRCGRTKTQSALRLSVTTETKPAVFKCQCAYVYGTRPASMGLDVGQGGTWRRDSALPSIERTEKQTVKGDHVRGGRWAAWPPAQTTRKGRGWRGHDRWSLGWSQVERCVRWQVLLSFLFYLLLLYFMWFLNFVSFAVIRFHASVGPLRSCLMRS